MYTTIKYLEASHYIYEMLDVTYYVKFNKQENGMLNLKQIPWSRMTKCRGSHANRLNLFKFK